MVRGAAWVLADRVDGGGPVRAAVVGATVANVGALWLVSSCMSSIPTPKPAATHAKAAATPSAHFRARRGGGAGGGGGSAAGGNSGGGTTSGRIEIDGWGGGAWNARGGAGSARGGRGRHTLSSTEPIARSSVAAIRRRRNMHESRRAGRGGDAASVALSGRTVTLATPCGGSTAATMRRRPTLTASRRGDSARRRSVRRAALPRARIGDIRTARTLCPGSSRAGPSLA